SPSASRSRGTSLRATKESVKRSRAHSDELGSAQAENLVCSPCTIKWEGEHHCGRRCPQAQDVRLDFLRAGILIRSREMNSGAVCDAYSDADCHFSHGMNTRSAKITKPYSKNPRIDKLNRETKDIDVRNSVLAMMMRCPSPSLPPTNSPMT